MRGTLSVKHFLAQKLITEMKHTPFFPDSALNDFLLFPKIKSALRGSRLQDTGGGSDNTGGYSVTGVPTTFPAVAASLG
jgi:hypothetical protein